jgi:hypothetical protein
MLAHIKNKIINKLFFFKSYLILEKNGLLKKVGLRCTGVVFLESMFCSFSCIWGIVDDWLRDVFVRGKYGDAILPMTVICRMDALLEDTKDAVLDIKDKMELFKQF